MKKMLFLLSAICISNLDAKSSSLDLLRDLVQLDNQELLSAKSFEQEVKKFIEQGGNINEPIFVSPFDQESVKFMTFLDPEKKQSLLSYVLVFGENSIDFVKTLLKHGANPLQDIYLKFGDDEVCSYKGTIFDSLLMIIIGDIEGIQRNICLTIMIDLLQKYDASTAKEIIYSVFVRFYPLLEVSDKNLLKDTVSSIQESNFTLKEILKESKKHKIKNEIFILETISKELEDIEHKLKSKLSKK